MTLAPALIAITDATRPSFGTWLGRLEQLLAAARAGSVLVLLRDRQLPIRERRQLGERLRRMTVQHEHALAVNDRLDLAVLVDADAVHLSESSVSVEDARAFGERLGRRWWVSRASHDPSDAASSTADALLLSPIAEPRKGRAPLGAEGLARARQTLASRAGDLGGCRLYALGGIGASDARRWLDAGADGVALIGALLDADAPQTLVDQLGLQRR
jgi:thiamine-phosphate pyrophosphorylase